MEEPPGGTGHQHSRWLELLAIIAIAVIVVAVGLAIAQRPAQPVTTTPLAAGAATPTSTRLLVTVAGPPSPPMPLQTAQTVSPTAVLPTAVLGCPLPQPPTPFPTVAPDYTPYDILKATLPPDYPPAKATMFAREQQQIATARAHPRPKPSYIPPPTISPQLIPTLVPTLIQATAGHSVQGPGSASVFVAKSFWVGPVGPVWLDVWAGSVGNRGLATLGSSALYVDITAATGDGGCSLGIIEAPSKVGPLRITSVANGIVHLRSDGGNTLAFDLRTRRWR